MSPAALSLAALVFALVLSCTSAVNVGLVAIVLAWLVGTLVAGLRAEEVLGGFPSTLFLTLAGVTLLFSQAQVNGTLDRIAHRAVRHTGESPAGVPLVFFALTAALSSIGPGNIAATALMAPLGMAAAARYGLSPFLMAVLIATGANAGSLSPVTATGVVVNGIAGRIGLEDVQWSVYLTNLLAHALVGTGAYVLLGGWRTRAGPAPRAPGEAAARAPTTRAIHDVLPFGWQHWLTAIVIASLAVAVVGFNLQVGLSAFAGAVVLTLARAADEKAAVRAMPWNVILMVCGVTVLVAVLERTGGIDLFAQFLARISTPGSSTAVAAFSSGLISIYSSTTGVVLPALLPTIPSLVDGMGGGSAEAIMYSMNIGGHLVDVSPLSTLGALCLAAAPAGTDTRLLFNKLLAWGLSMTVVSAALCWALF